jgi:hypothetical protein
MSLGERARARRIRRVSVGCSFNERTNDDDTCRVFSDRLVKSLPEINSPKWKDSIIVKAWVTLVSALLTQNLFTAAFAVLGLTFLIAGYLTLLFWSLALHNLGHGCVVRFYGPVFVVSGVEAQGASIGD